MNPPSPCATVRESLLPQITQGQPVWRRAGPVCGAQMVAYAPGREMPRHAHRTANITLILAGSFEEEIDGHDYLCGPLCVVIKPAGAVHATRCGEAGTRSLVVEVDAALESDLRRRYGLFDECRWFHELCGLAPCVLGLCRAQRLGSDAAIEAWLARLGVAAAAAPRPAREHGASIHVRRALEFLRRDPAIRTADLAQRLGLHPVYIARLFRERLACSPGQMRQGLRLGAAVDRIVQTEQPLLHVAHGAGFADQSHLSRHLKRYTGVPATALRRLRSGV